MAILVQIGDLQAWRWGVALPTPTKQEPSRTTDILSMVGSHTLRRYQVTIMLRYPESTPCPVVAPSALESSGFNFCEPTEEVNFTTEIRAAWRQAAPRRITSKRPQAQAGAITTESAGAVKNAGAATAQINNHHNRSNNQPNPIQHIADFGVPRRRASILPHRQADVSQDPAHAPRNDQGAYRGGDTTQIRKKPRRRTIYVPSDDTTILTIHPGVQCDTRTLSDYSFKALKQSDATLIDTQPQGRLQQQGNRMPLVAAPKRVPLQPTLKPLQEMEVHSDIPGSGPGKENLPPVGGKVTDFKGCTVTAAKAKRVSIFGVAPECNAIASDDLFNLDKVSAMDQTISKSGMKRSSLAGGLKRVTYSSEEQSMKKKPRESAMNRRNTLYYGSVWKTGKTAADPSLDQSTTRLPSKLIAPVVAKEPTAIKERYSVLTEDINRPEMFEDAWLDDQESAIQQLINGLFEAARKDNPTEKSSLASYRKALLQLYQSPNCSILYKRLQASLLYGALSPPEGSIAGSSRLKNDIGLRQKLLALWTGTYELGILRAATEVVIGREIPMLSGSPSQGHPSVSTMRSRKRELEGFIVSCLINNDDVGEPEQQSSAFCWRRAVLRSLMLVLLLDMAAETKVVKGNLFRTSSKLKSSLGVLTELCASLLPFIGDIPRSLSHLNYHLLHTQFPLSEYDYKINNLATDLRDGVRLTHLVELLLYPPETLSRLNENLTVAMPTGEVLTSIIDEGQSWVLSQHLKYPCIARTQKVYNLQIALSALRGISGIGQIAEGLSADDITDGHREKTVRLLWGLVGKWGLDSLVDFEELAKEIRRLGRSRELNHAMANDDFDLDEEDEGSLEGFERQMFLLKKWARTIASRHGLQVHNLTTSFADGKIFGRIVDEYQPYIIQDKPPEHSNVMGNPNPLDAKLKSIGCSASFGK